MIDFSIQTETSRILVSFVRVSLNGGPMKLNLGFSKTADLEEGGLLVQVLTGLAGVSSRNHRLPAPQTHAEAATAWGSSVNLSTVLCMILVMRTITMSE